MNAREFLAELNASGVQITLHGDNLRVRSCRGVRIAHYQERIANCKQELLAELEPLDGEIIDSEASRRTREEVAQRIARIRRRIEAGDDTRANWLALRYWAAIHEKAPSRVSDARSA